MPENPPPNSPPAGPEQPPAPEYTPGHMPITEEFDRAKWTMPPALPVGIAALAILIIGGIVAFTNRPKPVMSGSITSVARVDQEGSVVVAVRVEMDNIIDKRVWISNIDSELETADGKKYTDHAAPSGDVERYMTIMPALRAAYAEPLREEVKIPSKESLSGVAIFAYPVDPDTFDKRKSLTVRIRLYDQPTVIIKSP
jgi:hypothetical protein